MTTTSVLHPRHAAIFERSAIPVHDAIAYGAFTVETAADLPDDLRADYPRVGPGFVVPLRTVDGDIHHQLRLDTPIGNTKNLQPKGVGSIITVHKSMAGRVGVSRRILIVEGTRQTIAACLYAPGDVLVVGLQGCTGWSLRDPVEGDRGVPHPDLTKLGVAGAEIILLFDADYRTNQAVWLAASNLAQHMRILGASQVRFANFPASGKSGLDDFLGMAAGRADRPGIVAKIIDTASKTLGPKPAAKLKKSAPAGPVCDMRRGLTIIPRDDTDPSSSEKILYEVAGRVVEAVTVIDPDDQERIIPAQLKVELAFPGEYGPQLRTIDVPDDKLDDTGYILSAVRSLGALSIARPTGLLGERELANAIRQTERDKTTHATAYRRLGWKVDDAGTWRYMHQGGAIGPADTIVQLRSWMPARSRCINLPDPNAYTAGKMAGAVRSSIDNLNLIVDRTIWFALLGAVGIAPSGVIPQTSVGLVGPASAGKSALLASATSFLSPEFAYSGRVMTTADATPASIDLALSGHDNSFVLLDDFHPEVDPREQARQIKALDAALRRAHGAPSKGRAELSHGSVQQASANESHPVVLLSFEELPPAARSGIDRMLTIEVTRETTFKQGAFAKFIEPTKSGAFQVAYAGYIQWLAQRVAFGPGEDGAEWLAKAGVTSWPVEPEAQMYEWRNYVDSLLAIVGGKVADRVPSATSRACKVVAGLAVGFGFWLDWASSLGAVGDAEVANLYAECEELLTAAISHHTEVAMDGNMSVAEQTMEAIRSAIATNRVTLDDIPGSSTIRIGTITEVADMDGKPVKVLALNSKVQIPGVPDGWAKKLRPLALRDAHGMRSARQIRIGSVRPYCVVIPIEVAGIEDQDDGKAF